MIPIKIQCGCGQLYEFEVEPVEGRMPSTVACPTCGADGTAAANEAISQNVPAPPAAAAPASRLRLRASVSAPSPAPAPAHSGTQTRPGQVSHNQAEIEARAKISWGEPSEEVTRYLMFQGFSQEEAAALIRGMLQERKATIRHKGIGKIVVGALMVAVPIVAWFVFLGIGIIYLKLMAAAIIVGLCGAWVILSGIIMIVAPKSEKGDVAEE